MLRELNFAERRGLWNWIHESVGNPTIRRHFRLPSEIRSLGQAEELIRQVAEDTPALRSTLLWLPAGNPVISVGPLPTVKIFAGSKPDIEILDPLRQSAVFLLRREGSCADIEVELTIAHLFADAGGADALVRRLESAASSQPAEKVPRTDGAVEEERAARARSFWLGQLTGCGPPATPYCGVNRTSGHATTIVVPLPASVDAQVKELARGARVTTAAVWTAAVALMAQERCAGHEEVVCRLTCANRYTVAEASTVDYRAQPVFLPLLLPMDQPASQALRHVYRSTLLAHAHGWYDALHVVEQLNRPSRGAWFLPTVELNFLQGTRGSQVVGSTVKPYSFNPSSAKADMVVGVDDRTVSVTLRGAGSTALASELLERVTEWPCLLAGGGARPLAELVRQQDLPECSLLRGRGVPVNRASMQSLFCGALGHGDQYDMELDQAGHIVVHSLRPLGSNDALRLWCRQALVPNSVLPDRWITQGVVVNPRTLAETCLRGAEQQLGPASR